MCQRGPTCLFSELILYYESFRYSVINTVVLLGGRRDRMVVGFTNTYAIGAYRH
jgi:hypothetical protein